MSAGPYRYGTGGPPRPPSVFFDGTRLGLEGNMVATLILAIPAGIHIAISAMLRYTVRFEDLARVEPGSFSGAGLIFISILAIM